VASIPTSDVVQRRHEQAGVQFAFGETVVALHGEAGRATHVELSDGRRAPADLILVSIGVVPNSELAASAGLEVHNGVVVNEQLLTEDEAISAIGDCVSFPFLADGGRMVRLESVQNAVDQARHVAQRLTGQTGAYDHVPLFWSDQAGLRLQMAGLTSSACTPVVRGDPDAAAFSVFCYQGDRLVGVESVNRLPDHMQARKLLKNHVNPSPAQVADPAFDLKALANAPVAA
jgi:3-phenylpropionate/trans-cinnamate dioxygenase ferredoxin reductase subunit